MIKQIWRTTVSWVVSLLTISSLFFFFFNQKINVIACQNSPSSCDSSLYQKLEELKGAWIFNSDGKVRQLVEEQGFELISITKQFPGKLSIAVKAREKTPQLTTSLENLPVVATAEYDHERFMSFSESIAPLAIPVEGLVIQNQGVIGIQLSSGKQALVNLDDYQNQLKNLKLILEYLDLDSIDLAITEIDLRYKLPVLRTKQTFDST